MARRHKRRTQQTPPAEADVKGKPVKVTTSLGALIRESRKPKARGNTAEEQRSDATGESAKGGGDRQADRAENAGDATGARAPSQVASPARSPDRSEPEGPRAALSARELRLLNDAYAGATPLAEGKRRVHERLARRVAVPRPLAASTLPGEDDLVRARLDDLVGGGVRFHGEAVEDGLVTSAVRDGVPIRELRRLRSPNFRPDATLDLHGKSTEAAAVEVRRFVREHGKRGCRHLLIVHGKGLHSEQGRGVLQGVVYQTLTAGGAAPLVRALCLAHPQHGGEGATAVLLM